jgi:hypothetical protein
MSTRKCLRISIAMTFIKKSILHFCLLLATNVFAQHTPKPDFNGCAEFLLTNPVEKLYLHTDRDVFAENDTIWFKAYLVQAHTMKLDNSPLRNVYVELVAENQEVVVRNMLAMKDGISFGDFNLSARKISFPGIQSTGLHCLSSTMMFVSFSIKNNLITPVYDYEQGFESFVNRITLHKNRMPHHL